MIGDITKAQPGDKIYFESEKRPYTIIVRDEIFIICTKYFAAKHTVMYTIIDLKRQVRGTENLVFCMGFEDHELCQQALERLQKGESEVSYRNYVPLDVVKIKSLQKP